VAMYAVLRLLKKLVDRLYGLLRFVWRGII